MKAIKSNKGIIFMLLIIAGMIFAEGCRSSAPTSGKKCGCGADINGVYKKTRSGR
jgi:hypothetical protein